MEKKIIQLADVMKENGFTNPQISVFMQLFEDTLIEACQHQAVVKVGTVFNLKFSKKATKYTVLTVQKSQGLTGKLAYFGKKTPLL